MAEDRPTGQRPRGGGGATGAVRAWVGWWIVCAALWLALVDRVPSAELVLGAVAATIGATAAVLVRGERETVLRPRLRWLTGVPRPALALLADLWPLAVTLVGRGVLRRADPPGRLVEIRFDARGADPEQAAFRVLTAIAGSVGPNTIVAEVDGDAGVLRAHQLRPTDDAADAAAPLPR
jgi:multisubunit Na+/H+ antiporter MnhE subunit